MSVTIFWGILALSTWSLADSEKAVHTDSHRALSISSEVGSAPESNSLSLAQVELLLNNVNDFNQSVQLYAFLANTNETSLLTVLEASKSIASPVRRKTAQSAIIRKYASINPQRAFDHARSFPPHQQDALLTSIFREWSISSLNQAVETASTLDGRLRHIVLQTVLETRDDLPDSSRREIAERLGGEDFAMSLLAEEQAMALMDNPQEAWNTLVSDGLKNRSRIDAYVQIAVEWAELEGLEVLNEIAETLSQDVDYYNHIRDSVVIAVAQTNVVNAFKYVSSLDADIQRKLLHPVVAAWASIDPAAALKAVDELDNNSFTDMVENFAVNQWIRSRPREILPLLSDYSVPVQYSAMGRVAATLIRTTPQEALQLVQKWANAGFDMTSVAGGMIDEWSNLDPNAALEWLLSEKAEDWVNYTDMIETTVRGLASVDPTRAFEIAMEQPLPEEYMSGTEAWVILELSRTDLDKAIELLPQVRDSSKPIASIWVGQALVKNGMPYKALDLARHLPEDRRDSFYFEMTKDWGEHDALELFESLDSLATTVIQSNAARSLLWLSSYDSVLTKSQLEVVRSYLTEDHAEDVE